MNSCKQGRRNRGARGAIAPHFSLIFKKNKIKPCWLAKSIVASHTHKADNDCDKKTLAHYNSYL